MHDNAVLCISAHPEQPQIFATACESGLVSLYDLRLSNADPIVLASSKARHYMSNESSSDSDSSGSSLSSTSESLLCGAFQSCHFNPCNPNLIAAANEVSGVSLIDTRMNKSAVIKYNSTSSTTADDSTFHTSTRQNAMSTRFTSNGAQLGVLRAKLRPVIYDLNNPNPVYVLDHDGFSNSCTLKSFCFGGNKDQYFISGSDDFSVYCWKIPTSGSISEHSTCLISEAHLKLDGHRSIVNQCRYNKHFHLLATSGVEKIVKVWSTVQLPGGSGGLLGRDDELPPKRKVYTFNELFRRPGEGDNEAATSLTDSVGPNESIEEDRVMIAYFDSQIRRQRKIEQLLSESLDSNGTNSTTLRKKRRLGVALPTEESLSDEGDTQESSDETDYESGLSSDDSDESYSEPDESEDDTVELIGCKRQKMNHQSKKQVIPLRDRIRNLRHRRTLNLIEENDYLNVLDSLNVNTVPIDPTTAIELNSKFFHKDCDSSALSVSGSSQSAEPVVDGQAGTSLSFSADKRSSLKSLNKQKRKIELNIDENDAETNNESNSSDSSQETQQVLFKKCKRKNWNKKNWLLNKICKKLKKQFSFNE